jgi:predicted phage tail protein
MPVDAVVYITVLTLVIFLLFRIPSIWSGVDFTKAPRKEGRKSGGAAAIVTGVLCLTIQYFMAPTHTWGGVNYADAFNSTMTIVGSLLVLLGAGLVISHYVAIRVLKHETRPIQ